MAGLLGKLGVVAVFADFVSQHLAGFDWFWASFIISATFVYLSISCQWYGAYYSFILRLYSHLVAMAMGALFVYDIALWFDEQSVH